MYTDFKVFEKVFHNILLMLCCNENNNHIIFINTLLISTDRQAQHVCNDILTMWNVNQATEQLPTKRIVMLMSSTVCSLNRNLGMPLRWRSPIRRHERHHLIYGTFSPRARALSAKNDLIKYFFVFVSLRLLICVRTDTSARVFFSWQLYV